MTSWRMAFRDGKNGPSLWSVCRSLGVAAIECDPVENVDFTGHSEGQPAAAWDRLMPNERTSLHRFVHLVQPGHVIYVKEGPTIVCKGEVIGPDQYDAANRILASHGHYWRHQRDVRWKLDFRPVTQKLGRQQVMTIVPLREEDVLLIEGLGQSGTQRSLFRDEEEVLGDADEVFTEGRDRLRLHRKKERNPRAAKRKKELVLAATGKLLCEVCDFDFADFYGPLGEGFAEGHHRVPLSTLTEEYRLRLSDLAVVCANCHRMLHRRPNHGAELYLVEDLRRIVQARRAQ
jgi:hypothetical protein